MLCPLLLVSGHGRLMDPPARNAMWRFGYPNPVNYNDNELFCGGYAGEYSAHIVGELNTKCKYLTAIDPCSQMFVRRSALGMCSSVGTECRQLWRLRRCVPFTIAAAARSGRRIRPRHHIAILFGRSGECFGSVNSLLNRLGGSAFDGRSSSLSSFLYAALHELHTFS